MSYATQQDLIERFGELTLVQLTDRDGVSDVIDVAVLDRAIADADAVIDGYLAGRYALPLEAVPDLLIPIACDLAFYQLHALAAPEEVRTRYREAIRRLERIGSGQVRLDVAGVEPASGAGDRVRADSVGRVFTTDTLRDFVDGSR